MVQIKHFKRTLKHCSPPPTAECTTRNQLVEEEEKDEGTTSTTRFHEINWLRKRKRMKGTSMKSLNMWRKKRRMKGTTSTTRFVLYLPEALLMESELA